MFKPIRHAQTFNQQARGHDLSYSLVPCLISGSYCARANSHSLMYGIVACLPGRGEVQVQKLLLKSLNLPTLVW